MNVNDKLDIVDSHIRSSVPVQTVPLAHKLGLEVYKVSSWPDTLSGKIIKDTDRGGDSGYAIYVNGKHTEQRRRFTIAHEIAHYVLHEHLIGDGIFDDGLYRSNMTSSIEAQANRFAAAILMPVEAINSQINDTKDHVNTDGLASLFNVSRQAMEIRVGKIA